MDHESRMADDEIVGVKRAILTLLEMPDVSVTMLIDDWDAGGVAGVFVMSGKRSPFRGSSSHKPGTRDGDSGQVTRPVQSQETPGETDGQRDKGLRTNPLVSLLLDALLEAVFEAISPPILTESGTSK